jgi:hypothetical protein
MIEPHCDGIKYLQYLSDFIGYIVESHAGLRSGLHYL